MLFNLDKCKAMHIGNNNSKAMYNIGGQVTEEAEKEMDLGVPIQKDLNVVSCGH
jgi:hypothetical protein